MPLTFSFRLNEKEFYEDMQSFCKFFRSVVEDKPAKLVSTIDKQANYYVFSFKIASPDNNAQARKFKNPDVDDLVKDPIYFSGKNLWILKPSGLNRGKGLELFSTLDELSQFLKLYTTGYSVKEYINMQYNDSDNISPSLVKSSSQTKMTAADSNTSSSGRFTAGTESRLPGIQKPEKGKSTFPSFVIQKYMERPLLFKGYKFDIRAFGLLTQDMDLYVARYIHMTAGSRTSG